MHIIEYLKDESGSSHLGQILAQGTTYVQLGRLAFHRQCNDQEGQPSEDDEALKANRAAPSGFELSIFCKELKIV